jgi:hypothetical protein
MLLAWTTDIPEQHGGNKHVDNIVDMNYAQSLFLDIVAATGNKRLVESRTVHPLVDIRLGVTPRDCVW